MFVFLQGTGPCYNDQCSRPGESWCSGSTRHECHGAGMDQAYSLYKDDCATDGLTCVEGLASGYYGSETPQAWCVDVKSCDTPGEFACLPLLRQGMQTDGTQPDGRQPDGLPALHRCSAIHLTAWYQQNEIASISTPLLSPYIYEAVGVEGPAITPEDALPCVTCSSPCGCPEEQNCVNGLCVPSLQAGYPDEGLLCCGRERGTPCPKGASCQTVDGQPGTCAAAARCEPCNDDLDCESPSLLCRSSVGNAPKACLTPTDLGKVTYACRTDLNEAWSMDACGTYLALAQNHPVTYACKEDTDQSWSLNACDQWIAMVKDCGEAFMCQDNQCIERVAVLEVSPTLLVFGNVSLSTTKTLELLLGNTGTMPLTITELLLQPAASTQFSWALPQPLPATINVDQIVTMTVTFAPITEGDAQAKLLIRSTDKDHPEKTVLMNGSGIP